MYLFHWQPHTSPGGTTYDTSHTGSFVPQNSQASCRYSTHRWYQGIVFQLDMYRPSRLDLHTHRPPASHRCFSHFTNINFTFAKNFNLLDTARIHVGPKLFNSNQIFQQ